MTASSVSDLAADVRGGFDWNGIKWPPRIVKAEAALDELVARLEAAEAGFDNVRPLASEGHNMKAIDTHNLSWFVGGFVVGAVAELILVVLT